MEPVTPSKGKGAPVADEPTELHQVGDDTRLVVATYELAPGTTLGEYQIEAFLGRGGMGEVFTAVHPMIGKRAAVKVLKRELSSSFNLERFKDEARIVNAIGHPNIVDIFAFGEMPDGRCYFVMELLVGESLRERIARGPIEIDEVCAILKPLTRALDAAHAKGVIHRDLKPDNIFLVAVPGEKAIVKLLDFGIAKLAKADHRVEQTKSGVMVGTPQYIAPEQAKGHAIDQRADIYALGGIVFEMLTGRPPFVADNAMEMVAKHLMEPAPKPSSVNPAVSPELDSLVTAMLAKEPARRPALVDIATVIDRLKLGPINMEDARTLSYSPNSQTEPRAGTSGPTMTPLPMTPQTQAPYAAVPVLTPSTGFLEPQSGAHTAVEPAVTELTDKDAVTIRRPRGLVIGVSIALLGVAAIISFVLVKLLAGDGASREERKDAQIVTATTEADAAKPTSQPIEPIDAAEAARAVDAGVTVIADAALATPDARHIVPVPVPRPKVGKLTIVVANPTADTVILVNGVKVGTNRRAEITLPIGSTAIVAIRGGARKPLVQRVAISSPAIARTFELEGDLMSPGQK